jgi:tellurite resistance protein TerC
MEVGLSIWVGLVALIALLIALDFVLVSRKPHDVLFKEAALWSVFYVAVAVAFGAWVWKVHGSEFGTEYFAAYLVEKSLSIDNLFIFVIILTQFAVPSILHQRILLIGVILALVFRAIFIAVGAAALHAFAFTFVIFGAILIWTGVALFRHRDEEPNPSDNAVIRLVKKLIPITDEYHGTKIVLRRDGKRIGTPLLLVVVAIASTDLLFALDSIPATYGVTSEPLLVFAANAFALLGLRALYFLLKGLLDKLVYLSIGLSAILIFIGFKLVALYFHEINSTIPKIPTSVSLLVIVAILGIATVASIRANRKSIP